MMTLETRWGGSLDEMRAFVSDDHVSYCLITLLNRQQYSDTPKRAPSQLDVFKQTSDCPEWTFCFDGSSN
jgi:hypothetical protein